jgi:hypothetical protein
LPTGFAHRLPKPVGIADKDWCDIPSQVSGDALPTEKSIVQVAKFKCKDIIFYGYHQSDTTSLALRMDSEFCRLLLLIAKKIKAFRRFMVN